MRELSMKSLENQLNHIRLNPNAAASLAQLAKSEEAMKYKEKLTVLDDKYQGLKKKYVMLQQQY